MNKPNSLRKALEQAIPAFKKDPDNLVMFIDEGTIHCSQGESISFKYYYQLNILALNYNQHPDHFFISLLQWIVQHEPALLRADGTAAIQFEAEAIKHKDTDISVTLRLSEPVIVTMAEGSYTATHQECPPLLEENGPTDWTLFINGEPLVEPEPAE